MSWEPGTQVDRYRILDRLGAGGMGVVYRALDLETRTDYALKTLPVSADPELVERFRREGEAQARTDAHPNVVRIHSSGTALGQHYLVMDLAPGGDLADLLRRGPLDPERARDLRLAKTDFERVLSSPTLTPVLRTEARVTLKAIAKRRAARD